MNNKKREILIVTLILILQTVIFAVAGINKSYIHMDEAYSLGLASYDKIEIQDNEDFYNTWHNNTYYEDYLSVNDDEKGSYSQVYENQKNDVHPPLYYLLLRFSMGFNLNHFAKYSGIILNIVIYLFITVFMYLILQLLFKNQKYVKEKSIILAFLSAITLASLSNAIYIRMYALSTLNILITTFLHLKLSDSEKPSIKLLIAIGLSALLGSLTHYYYLFYLAGLYLLFAIKYIKNKQYKNLLYYTLSIVIAAAISLMIFPYSIKHLFFGYRGQGALSKLLDINNFLQCIGGYLLKINVHAFNNMLFILLIVFILLLLNKKEKTESIKNKYTKYLVFPTVFYFILVALSSPWIELRYIMPISGLVFVIFMYYLYTTIQSMLGEKFGNIIISVILLITMLAPFAFKLEPEVMYSDKKQIVQDVSNRLNVPTIYFFNSNNNRFLDDILLFSILDESYVAKDINCTEENVQKIFKDKDISKGILVFINEGQENDDLIDVTKKAMNLNESTYVKRLNACDVYYIY